MVSPDRWWPGWRVYWNGTRLPPVRVNQTFVGSWIPEGEGTLQFLYRPDEVDEGLRISLLGWLLLIGIVSIRPTFPHRIRQTREASALMRIREARFGDRLARAASHRVLLLRLLALAALAGWFGLLLVHRVEIAGGADSSGYLTESRLWLQGKPIRTLTLPRELHLPSGSFRWFIPLGFVPGPSEGTMVPSYPPGLPLQMAALTLIGGSRAPFLLSPLAALASVLLLFVLARQFGLERGWSAAAAVILGVFPTLLFIAIQPMSDVVATAWILAALVCGMRSRHHVGWGVAAGLAVGIAVLVRPTNILILPALMIAVGLRRRHILALAGGATPAMLALMAINQHLYGSPFRTGYGDAGVLLAWSNIPSGLQHYGGWLMVLMTPLVFPLGLAGLGVRDVPGRLRLLLATWFGSFFVFYCVYQPYDAWWFTRFLLPAFPAVILSLLLLLRVIARRLTAGLRVMTIGTVLALVIGTGIWHVRHKSVFEIGDGEQVYEQATRGVEKHVPANAILIGMQMSGAIYHTSGTTMLRWDALNADRFELIRAHAALDRRPLYALLFDFERPEVFTRTGHHWTEVERWGPVALYRPEAVDRAASARAR